jgi:protein N-terminal amidase
MDINPYEFKDSSKFELADFCLQKNVDVLLFLTAWNDHEPENDSPSTIDGIINYWLWRLQPLI